MKLSLQILKIFDRIKLSNSSAVVLTYPTTFNLCHNK